MPPFGGAAGVYWMQYKPRPWLSKKKGFSCVSILNSSIAVGGCKAYSPRRERRLCMSPRKENPTVMSLGKELDKTLRGCAGSLNEMKTVFKNRQVCISWRLHGHLLAWNYGVACSKLKSDVGTILVYPKGQWKTPPGLTTTPWDQDHYKRRRDGDPHCLPQ